MEVKKKQQAPLQHQQLPRSSRPMLVQPLWSRPTTSPPQLLSSSRQSSRARRWSRRQLQAAVVKLRSSSLRQLSSKPLLSSLHLLLCSRSRSRSNKMRSSKAQRCIPPLPANNSLQAAQWNNQSNNLHLSNHPRRCNHLSSKCPTNNPPAHRVSPNSRLSHSLLSSSSRQCSRLQCSSQSSSNPANSSRSSRTGSREAGKPPGPRIGTLLFSPEASSTSHRV